MCGFYFFKVEVLVEIYRTQTKGHIKQLEGYSWPHSAGVECGGFHTLQGTPKQQVLIDSVNMKA